MELHIKMVSELTSLNINTKLTPQKYRRLNDKTFVSIPLIEEFSS
jgi:hypothetical protein